MEKFSVQLPISGEYLSTVRLTTGGLCSLMGFDIDSAEDFKVCVTESLLILKRNGYLSANIRFTVGETLGCEIVGEDLSGKEEDGLENEISKALLCALVGNVEFVDGDDGKVQNIVFEG